MREPRPSVRGRLTSRTPLEKRLPLALFLSLLVLVVWSKYFAPPPPKRPVAEDAAVTQPADAATPTGQPAAPSEQPAEQEPAAREPAGPQVGTVVADEAERKLELEIGTPGERGSYRAIFSNRGGSLVDLWIGNYYDHDGLSAQERADRAHWTRLLESAEAPEGRTRSMVLRTRGASQELVGEPLDRALWKMRELDPADGDPGVEFELAQGRGVRFVKRIQFEPNSHRVHVHLELVNEALDASGPRAFSFTPAAVMPQELGDRFYIEPQAVAAGFSQEDWSRANRGLPRFAAKRRDDKGKQTAGAFDLPAGVTSFAGVQNKYFAVLLRAADAPSLAALKGATWRLIRDEAWARENPLKAAESWHHLATDVLLELPLPARGETIARDYLVYCGPKDRDLLIGDYPDHEALIEKDLGFFDGIARILLSVLGFFERLTGNWGVAIILMTVSVRLVLFPINRRSQTSMARYQKKMKRIQPKIDELKKRYEKDSKKQREEQTKLMQEEGAFPPLGGCLPIFVQMPVFFGLFAALRTSFDLRQAPFLGWIRDLSRPDHLMHLNLHTGLPIIGTVEWLNVLPPLMVVLWVAQQLVMPKPADEQAQKMQRMMMFMPVVMGVFLYNYAAGLSLYMITQSTLGIIEVGVIKKVWPVDDAEPVKKKTGFMARMAERQAAHMKQRAGGNTRKGSGKKRRR